MKGFFESIDKYKDKLDGLDQIKDKLEYPQYNKIKADIIKELFECIDNQRYKEDIYANEYTRS